MASVYRGFDRNLQRPVAIKVLVAEANQTEFARRFKREARLVASLRHPNIVQIYAFGEGYGYIYMVQELLTGITLKQHLRDLTEHSERLSRHEILVIVAQLASALDAAHIAGIIHRDVKPSNVMWNASGEVILTDFGIAKRVITGSDQTLNGVVIGTPSYLSPEQAQGLPVTQSSDIYSLGVMLYELIAGRVPFVGDNPMSVVIQHVQNAPPPMRSFRPDIPPNVEGVVQRALAKNPAARFSRASDLARALKRAWPPATAPSTMVMMPNVHNQPTSHWKNGSSGAPLPLARADEPRAHDKHAAAPLQRATTSRPAALMTFQSSAFMPLMILLVVILLIGGMALAL
jgi:serine/threonine-protein kinase